ncbi:hypothetical protein MMC12_007859 [Toensbergia leucococca]|nr:hypothetical protein [Toensbergia leucococca]
MEAGAVAAAYGVETAIEATIGAAIAISKATMPLRARFERIPTAHPLPRSSHSLSVISGRAYIFGGEIRPREPVDNTFHIYTLPSSGVTEADYREISARASIDGDETPHPRVGHTAAVVGDRIFVFGGRGGPEMKPLEELGRVWVFDTKSSSWDYLDPVTGSPYPEARSFHASVATEHPLKSLKNHTQNPVGDSYSRAHGTIFIHGGCPTSGRVADVWAFDIASQIWSRYPDAPGPARGGPGLAFTQNRLYRYGGFDGENELGGQLDYLDISVSTFDDKGAKGELAMSYRSGNWQSIKPSANSKVPGNRSVASLQPITTGQGRNFLLLFFGEKIPSSSGHETAGRFWDDVWAFQLRPDGKTAASFKDATRQLVGATTSEESWEEVEIPEFTMTEGQRPHPGERGWFASAPGQDIDKTSVVIWGGLNGNNERAGDGWNLKIEI